MASTSVLDETDSTPYKNVIRIARLLIGEGTKLLREIFDLIFPPSILPNILKHPTTVNKLKSAVITKAQWDCLYPSLGVTAESTDFDFALLLTLLMTICDFTPPIMGWDALPVTTDQSTTADLARINCYGRSLFSHLANKMEMLDESFLSLWENVKKVFHRIASEIGSKRKGKLEEAITILLNDLPVVMDAKETEELKMWYMTQTEVNKAIKEKKASTKEKHGNEIETSIGKEQKEVVEKGRDVMMKSQHIETLFRNIAEDIKDPLRRELRSLTQVQEGVENLGIESFPTFSTEKIIVKTTEFQKKDGVDLHLHIECVSISGPGLQGGNEKRAFERDKPMREEALHKKKHRDTDESKEKISESTCHSERTQATSSWGDGKNHEESILVTDEDLFLNTKIAGQATRSITSNKREATAVGDLRSLKERVLCRIAMNYLQTEPPRSSEEHNEFMEYLEKMRVLITGVSVGSLIVITHCTSLEILDTLWDSYCTGLLNEITQKYLVTEEILEEFRLTEMRLKTTISEEEYRAGREYFLRDSGNSECFNPRAVSPGAFGPESGSDPMECESKAETDSKLEDLQQQEMEIGSMALSQSIMQFTSNESGPESGSDPMECESQVKTGSKLEDPQQQEEMEIGSNALLQSMIQSTSIESESCLVDKNGTLWKLQEIQAAGYIEFSPNAVPTAILFTCTLLDSTLERLPLGKNEELVSDVIHLSCNESSSSGFTGEFDETVTVALSHSAAKLKGYEVVIGELVDSTKSEWKDLETTNVWETSDVEGNLLSRLRVPFAEARVTRCSTYAVICRLKSHTYSIEHTRSQKFICKIPEYPDLQVTIPAEIVTERNLHLTLKVQEIPEEWLEESGVLVGPVLHIRCSSAIQLLEPAEITLPMSLRADAKQYEDLSTSDMVVSANADDGTTGWKDITKELPRPVELNDGVVTFQVTHFTRFCVSLKERKRLRDKRRKGLRRQSLLYHLADMKPRAAGFAACLCEAHEYGGRKSQLRFCCYPSHLEKRVREEWFSTYSVFLYGCGSSNENLYEDVQITASLHKGLKTCDDASADDFILRFNCSEKYESEAIVQRKPGRIPQIKFIKKDGLKCLRTMRIVPPQPQVLQDTRGTSEVDDSSENIRSSSSNGGPTSKRPKTMKADTVKEGCPTLEELQDLAQKLDKWKPLGRHLLNMDESRIEQIENRHKVLEECAYQTLRVWKQTNHTAATYRTLHTALCRVNRRDLAEEFCCVGTGVSSLL